VKALPAAVVAALVFAAAFASNGSATNECRGITTCIPVPGPWVAVSAHGSATFLLSCPGGRSVVGGLDAQVTSRAVHVGFDGRLGAPVGPGVTTTRYALFRAVSTSPRPQLFQPLLGCVPVQGGGGRSTVSARVSPPGPAAELRSRIVVVGPGELKVARAACLANERLAGSWSAVAFRTKQPPPATDAQFVRVHLVAAGRQATATAVAADSLSIDVHAVVQAGAVCVQ